MGYIAGVVPAIFKALDLDRDLAVLDRFRQARNITSLGDVEDFKKEFACLRSKLDDARMASIPST